MGCCPKNQTIATAEEENNDVGIGELNYGSEDLEHYVNNKTEILSIDLKNISKNNQYEDKFIREIVNEINRYRSMHGSEDLTIDEKINSISQSYSEKLARESIIECSGNLYRGQELGEILFLCNDNISPKELISNCYLENSENYDYSEEPKEPNNFTQLIWKSTEFIGVGYTNTKDNKIYIVLNFYPPGNIKGEYLDNVLSAEKITDMSSMSFIGNLYEEMLNTHNNLRFKHKVSSLTLNANLSTLAQKYANFLYQTLMKEKKHVGNVAEALYEGQKCGINVFIGDDLDARDIMNLWYKQKKNYDFKNEKNNNYNDIRYFTQLVWKNTKDLGFGCVNFNNNEKMIFVALYFPCGNIVGEYKNNVFDEDK